MLLLLGLGPSIPSKVGNGLRCPLMRHPFPSPKSYDGAQGHPVLPWQDVLDEAPPNSLQGYWRLLRFFLPSGRRRNHALQAAKGQIQPELE